MNVKVIKNREEHQAALEALDLLMDLDPDPGTPEADEFELLAVVIENFENEHFPIDPPDPIEAIKFRMEHQGLKQRDLVPFIGSKSKASEVLSRKRQLSLPMIRALSAGLEIPVEILAREPEPAPKDEADIDWSRFPIHEMFDRGWLNVHESEVEPRVAEILREFFERSGSTEVLEPLYRRTVHSFRTARKVNRYALAAWTARVLSRAREERIPGRDRASVNLEFMREIARLSVAEDGPRKALKVLNECGIALIIEPQLRRTYLDGCVLFLKSRQPVIGMTIRYDRTDNFWFTLMHELAHVSLHSDTEIDHIYDDLQLTYSDDPRESDSDRLAMEALIPGETWQSFGETTASNRDTALMLAKRLAINPAIVAGRIRYETKNYRILSQLVGNRRVRRLFPDVAWPNQLA